ncbi:MAG TPA: sulfotransferase domain-containing protein [Actinomycetes bacterium]|nr:sulfotransferase domain-containing protein [Actinomycetes bacterium]
MTSSRLRLPDFLIIGAMKAGTTTLYNYLREHPDVFMPLLKEPEFFVAEKSWRRGLGWYSSLFAAAGDAALTGEASTSYTKFTEYRGVPARIKSVIPNVRMIYVVRHPLRRIESMYEHMTITGRENRPIDEAVQRDTRYVGPSLYGRNLALYLEHFDASQILTFFTDDLNDDVQGTLARVATFLGVQQEPLSGAARRDLESSGRRTDRRLKSSLRNVTWAQRAYLAAPQRLREEANRVLTKGDVRSRPTLSQETVEQLLPTLIEDAALLHDLTGSSASRWDLAAPPHSASQTSQQGIRR